MIGVIEASCYEVPSDGPVRRAPSGRAGVIEWVAVHENHRRSGTGSALVAAAISELRSKAADYIYVCHGANNPLSTLGFWGRFGFEPVWGTWEMTVGETSSDGLAPEARQMAVASQLLTDDAAASSPMEVLSHLGAIQLDAMQRVDKSHRLVCFSRLSGLNGRQGVDGYFWASEGPASAFEMWAHAVSLVPVEDWPLWSFRRKATRAVSWAPPAQVCDRLVDKVRDCGPQTIRDLEAGGAKTSGWDWSDSKKAAEYLVWTGGLVCCARSGQRRVYDLPERRIPAGTASPGS